MITLNLKTLEKKAIENKIVDKLALKYFAAGSILSTVLAAYYPLNFYYLDTLGKALFISGTLIYLFSIYFIYTSNKNIENFLNKYIAISFVVFLYATVFNFFFYKISDFIYVSSAYNSLSLYIYSFTYDFVTFWPITFSLITFYLTYRSFERINKKTN